MKYVKKLPPTDKTLSRQLEEDGWKKIKEPKSLWLATLLSLPLCCLLLAVTVHFAYLLNPGLFVFMESASITITISFDLKSLLFIVILYLYMLVHEMIHAMLIPNFLKSEKAVWGLNGIFGFVATTEPMKKARFLIVSAAPFVMLSIVALVLFYAIGILNGYTLALCLINAGGACVDFLNILLVAVQVKNGSMIVNNGFETYYRAKY